MSFSWVSSHCARRASSGCLEFRVEAREVGPPARRVSGMEVAEWADAAGAGRVEGVEVAGGMKRRDCGL